jgi:hypothetical protein
VVWSKGHEVVRSGYSRVISVAAKVTDNSKNSDNHDLVNRVSQNSNTDRQADQVGQVTPNSSTGRRTDQVSRVDNTEQKKEVPVVLLTQKVRLWKIRLTRRAGLRRIRLTRKTGLCKTRVGGGGQEIRRRKMCYFKQKASSMVVPKGYYQNTKTLIAKDASKRVGREKTRGRA